MPALSRFIDAQQAPRPWPYGVLIRHQRAGFSWQAPPAPTAEDLDLDLSTFTVDLNWGSGIGPSEWDAMHSWIAQLRLEGEARGWQIEIEELDRDMCRWRITFSR